VLPPRIVLALASGTTAEEKPLPSIAEEPGPVNLLAPNGGYLTESAPLGGAFLIPRPLAVVGDSSSASMRPPRRLGGRLAPMARDALRASLRPSLRVPGQFNLGALAPAFVPRRLPAGKRTIPSE
jgi:hypothetical protein